MKRAAVEDSVHGTHDRPAIGRHRRKRQQTHPDEPLGDLLAPEPALRSVDPEQVRGSSCVAAVEQLLQVREVAGRLVHPQGESGRRPPSRPVGAARLIRSQRLRRLGGPAVGRCTPDDWDLPGAETPVIATRGTEHVTPLAPSDDSFIPRVSIRTDPQQLAVRVATELLGGVRATSDGAENADGLLELTGAGETEPSFVASERISADSQHATGGLPQAISSATHLS
jgi:hypothetical protein